MTKNMKTQIVQTVLTISGLVVIGSLGGWWDALGVFLVIFGHNVERHSD